MVKRPYSPEEIAAVRSRYAGLPTLQLALELGTSVSRLNRLAARLGVRKERAVIAAMARERTSHPDHPMQRTQFKKGIIPFNKGKKMPGYAPGRMAETQFKKGNANYNKMPIGATRWIGSGTGSRARYLYRKVSDVPYVPYTVNWKPVHILYWEKHRGPVPPGHAIVFKDRNPEHIRMPNLECISRADLMRRNTIHKLPEPLKEVIRLKGAIKRVITCKRRNRAKEQNVGSSQPSI